jgi:hypothetical protein
MAANDDNRRFCPHCQQPRPMLFGPYGWLQCRMCCKEFTLSDSLRAALVHALRTIAEVAAKGPR